MSAPSRAELGFLTPAETAFMVARHQARRLQWTGERCTGISSDALADYALGLRGAPTQRDYPYDPSDLAACERTYRMAPPELQAVMAPVLALYRAAVEKRYPHATARVQHYIDTGIDLPAEHFATATTPER